METFKSLPLAKVRQMD